MSQGKKFSAIQREQIIEDICTRMMQGESIRQICRDKKLPNRITILRWMNEDEQLATTIARARQLQADALDDDIQDVINEVRSGSIKPDAARVVIWALQWRASKMRPKRYGNHTLEEQPDKSETMRKLQSIIEGKMTPEEATRKYLEVVRAP